MNLNSISTIRVFLAIFASFVIQSGMGNVRAQRGLEAENDTLTSSILIHPPVATEGNRSVLFTREHTYRPQYILGDQLARDFIVMTIGDDGIMRPFNPGSEGRRNEDWYTWRQDVLAPFDGTVKQVQPPDSTNQPGRLNADARHGEIDFENEDGVMVHYAHVREIDVEEGQRVEPGEVVAKVGNNGSSIAPHLHVGAWESDAPLQVQVDLYARERPAAPTGGE